MPKYIALQSVGALLPGEEIKGLNDDRIQALLASGAIEEYKPPEQTQSDNSADELEKLKGEVEDLKASNKQLETDLATATAKPAKEKPAADKGTPETK